MLEAKRRINLAMAPPPGLPVRAKTKKKTYPHDRYSQSRYPVFRPDLYRLRLRQGERAAGAGAGLDELLPALCFAARVAVRDHVKNPVRGTQQPAVLDRDHPRHVQRLCPRNVRRPADRKAA